MAIWRTVNFLSIEESGRVEKTKSKLLVGNFRACNESSKGRRKRGVYQAPDRYPKYILHVLF